MVIEVVVYILLGVTVAVAVLIRSAKCLRTIYRGH